MVAPGAKGSFPSRTDDATKPKNIIALSNPHTKTTGFQGTRMYMPEPPGTKSDSRLSLLYCEKPHTFHEHLASVCSLRSCNARWTATPERRVMPGPQKCLVGWKGNVCVG